MRYTIWVFVVTVSLLAAACGSQEPPAAKPAAPVAPAPAQPPAPSTETVSPPATAPVQPREPVAVVAEAPPKPMPAPAPTPKPAPVSKLAGPEFVTFDASQGKVTLPHSTHAKAYPCTTCHGVGTPGNISLGKDAAHDLCRSCHKEKGAGPTTCTGCHKK